MPFVLLFFSMFSEQTPFCIFQKQDRVTIAQGRILHLNLLDELPTHAGTLPIHSISMIPYCQIKERGFKAIDGGEPIIALIPETLREMSKAEFLAQIVEAPDLAIVGDLRYNLSDAEYEEVVAQVIEKEIKQGEGSNFLLSRKTCGMLSPAGLPAALTILARFMRNEFGSYMNFCFSDGATCFVGASPERHLSVFKGEAYLNPISGTLPKAQANFHTAFTAFLQDPKEIHELFQVVDEELKMMAKICKRGGEVEGPFLKEMRTLLHTEYLLKGETDMPPLDAFRATMFAPTMIGSPLENACRVICKYERDSRRYYSSAMLILGEDDEHTPFLDSAITIRTLEIGADGHFTIQSGGSIVRDSVPKNERIEATTKALGAIKAMRETTTVPPILEKTITPLQRRTLMARNDNLSQFWLRKQAHSFEDGRFIGKSALIIDNEDDFVYMFAHILEHLGLTVRIKKIATISLKPEELAEEIIILGPGPGDPENEADERICRLNRLAENLRVSDKKFMGICFGHQVISRSLGLRLERLDTPLQGVQKEILLFDEKEMVGFYNTFVAVADEALPSGVRASVSELGEVYALAAPNFRSFQFHPESVLTRNGLNILKRALRELLA